MKARGDAIISSAVKHKSIAIAASPCQTLTIHSTLLRSLPVGEGSAQSELVARFAYRPKDRDCRCSRPRIYFGEKSVELFIQ
ncbi:hypothetical protein [Nostoc sp.]|uniref:hypothetical protein n=1 Tax=Nostoc sp. TaxID=1180 RepID=UPI002FF83FFC